RHSGPALPGRSPSRDDRARRVLRHGRPRFLRLARGQRPAGRRALPAEPASPRLLPRGAELASAFPAGAVGDSRGLRTASMDLGITWALAALVGAGAKSALDALREHRTEPSGLADLLLWGYLVAPGTILQKDGSLLSAFRFRGPDLSSSTPSELASVARQVNDALLPLTDRWLIHADAIRRPAAGYPPTGAFESPLLRLLDEERRADYERAGSHFETDFVLALTYAAPSDLTSRLEALFVSGREARVDWSGLLDGYRAQIDDFGRRLAAPLRLERLDSDALLGYLHECLTGESHPVRTPPPSLAASAELDVLLGDRDLVGGWRPAIGDRAIRAVAVLGFPHASWAGMLDRLNGLGLAFRASHRILPFSRPVAEKEIRRIQLHWFRSRKGLASWVREIGSRGTQKSVRAEQMDEMFEDGHATEMMRDAAEAASPCAGGH